MAGSLTAAGHWPGHVSHVTCSTAAQREGHSVTAPGDDGCVMAGPDRLEGRGDTPTLSVINHWKMCKLKIKILSSSRRPPLSFLSQTAWDAELVIRSHDDSRSQSTNLKSCQVQSKFLASKDSFHPLYMSLLPGGGAGTRQSFISSLSLSADQITFFSNTPNFCRFLEDQIQSATHSI